MVGPWPLGFATTDQTMGHWVMLSPSPALPGLSSLELEILKLKDDKGVGPDIFCIVYYRFISRGITFNLVDINF